MEQPTLDYDSDIIVCDNIPETISITSSPERKKSKKKKHKRKVKKGVNVNNNMETLIITQKMKLKKCKVKRTKFKCVININTVCEERGGSIVRSKVNVCKREAYFQRIVPVCLRKICSNASTNCCRSTMSRDYDKYIIPKAESLSPVSSIGLSEIFSNHNISYEDVSIGNFSSVSEDELDTLIKRTKQREKQIDQYSAREHITSTPMSRVDNIPSPFSIEDKKSIHSDNTMILNPLSSEAYSPTSNVIDNLENIDDMIDIHDPYAPVITTDFVKIGANKLDDEYDDACSPTYTQETIDMECKDYDNTRNLTRSIINAHDTLMPTPDFIRIENFKNENEEFLENANTHYGNEMYSPSSPTKDVKLETLNIDEEKTGINERENVEYPLKSPTMTPQFKYTVTETAKTDLNVLNVTYIPTVTSKIIKQENFEDIGDQLNYTQNSDIDLIKKENVERIEEQNNSYARIGTDYNMNKTILCKSQNYDDERDEGKMVVKTERSDNENYTI